jgi:PST family polysaccharide transporter
MGAKVLLAIVCLAVVPILQQFVRPFRQHALFLWAGSLSGIGQGFSMLWFYQGMERMKTAARVDVCGKAAVAAGIFFFVHDQNDAWKVLALQCVGYGGTSVALLVMAYRNIRFRWPTPRATARALRESAAMFLFRSAVSLYTTANALILGAVGTPLAVGLYSGAERIIKALLGLLNPISQSVYPRLNRLLARDHERAVVLARASLGIMLLGGFAMCFGVIIAAPLIVRAVLGPGYGSAIPVIRVLSLLLPAIALSNVLGIQWMLPLGLDAAFNKIIVSAGFLNLGLALWWAHRWQQMGMAWAVVASECTVTLAMMAVLVRNRLNPLSDPRALESTIHEKVAAVEC